MSSVKRPQRALRRHTIKWAAECLGYSVPHVRALIARGVLRTYGTGHATRIGQQAIADCVATLEAKNAARRQTAA